MAAVVAAESPRGGSDSPRWTRPIRGQGERGRRRGRDPARPPALAVLRRSASRLQQSNLLLVVGVERVVGTEERELERGTLGRPRDPRLERAPVLDDEACRLVNDLAHKRRRTITSAASTPSALAILKGADPGLVRGDLSRLNTRPSEV